MDKPIKIPEPPTPDMAPKPPGLTVEQIALLQAARWFEAYADGHAVKPNGHDKAERNRRRARFCRLVAQPGHNVRVELHEPSGLLHGVSTITGDMMWGSAE